MSDVAVVGAGLVGVSLAYELACLGTSVTVIDAGHPGRATDAGAGILSPVTSHEADDELWPFLRQAGAHYPALLERMEADGAATAGTGYGRCGILSIGLRAHEDGWFSPFADTVLRRAPREVAEITPEEAGALFPPLGPVHRVLHAPGSARVDGRGMAAALREAAQARGVEFVSGAAHGVTAAGLSELLRECLTVAPGLDGATYLETRVGLRPTSADDRAAVGRLPGWSNAWVATGHGANGLLQGPYSARALAHAITGVALPSDEAPLPGSFDPGRFGSP